MIKIPFSFLVVCCLLYTGFIFIKICQHNHYIYLTFENQRLKTQKKKLLATRNNVYKNLLEKSNSIYEEHRKKEFKNVGSLTLNKITILKKKASHYEE